MDHPKKNIVSFKDTAKYKGKTVTVDVTAHFLGDEGTLKSKIRVLLVNDIHRPRLSDKLAHSRGSDGIL